MPPCFSMQINSVLLHQVFPIGDVSLCVCWRSWSIAALLFKTYYRVCIWPETRQPSQTFPSTDYFLEHWTYFSPQNMLLPAWLYNFIPYCYLLIKYVACKQIYLLSPETGLLCKLWNKEQNYEVPLARKKAWSSVFCFCPIFRCKWSYNNINLARPCVDYQYKTYMDESCHPIISYNIQVRERNAKSYIMNQGMIRYSNSLTTSQHAAVYIQYYSILSH